MQNVQAPVFDATALPEDSGVSPTGSLLPQPNAALLSGDPATALAALAIQNGKDERDIERTAKSTFDAIEDREEQAEVDQMHQKADDIRSNALISSGLEVSAGAPTCAGAKYDGVAKTLDAGGKAYGALGKATEEVDEATIRTHEHAANHAKRAAEDARDGVKDATELIKTAIDFYREYTTAKDQAQSAATHRA
jgi:hypothetical protein